MKMLEFTEHSFYSYSLSQNAMHYFLPSWKGLFLAVFLISSITFVGPTANASSIKLKGDIEVVDGDSPYEYLLSLRIGAGLEDPPEGKLIVKDGAFLSDYNDITIGGYFPRDPGNFPIPVLPYEGTMVVKDGSVVELGANMLVGTFADSIGRLTISDNSTVRAAGGMLAIAWIGFPESSGSHIGFFEGSEGEVILRDGSEFIVSDLRVGTGGRGVLRVKDRSRVTSRSFVNIGRDETGNGFATFRDGSSFHILGNADGFGAFLTVGRSARGELRLIESDLLIDGEVRDQAFDGGFQLGRNPGSHGTVMVRDSTITVRNMDAPFVGVGRAGFGSLVLKGNSTLVVEDQDGFFGVASGRAGVAGSAVVSIGADALLDAGGVLDLCGNGTAGITVDGVLRAAEIYVGPGCTIDGKGTIEGNVINLGGSISEGITIVP